jgi:hypothetical protein
MNEFKFRAEDMIGAGATPENEITRNPNNDAGGGNTDNPKPEDPIIIDPDVPVMPVTYKRGDCSQNSIDVLPCLSCQITMKPIGLPMSEKAKQLLKIMQNGCAVRNKSDPAGYRPPSNDKILSFLNRASNKMYPTTTPTQRQQVNISKWVSNDANHLNKLFGGLWYHPPYSDDFETYFGLEPKEARYLFCYGAPVVSFDVGSFTQLMSIDYTHCVHESGPGSHCRESVNYVQANVYRQQLNDSIVLSLNDPQNEEEMVPANKCHWESMSGFYNLEMETKLLSWKNGGYTLGVYFETGTPRCEPALSSNIPLNAKVTIAGKQCTDF